MSMHLPSTQNHRQLLIMNTKELPKEIRDIIDSNAIHYAGDTGDDPTGPLERAYEAGATAWARIAIGFKDWCEGNASQIDFSEQRTHTTEELLLEYIKTLPQ